MNVGPPHRSDGRAESVRVWAVLAAGLAVAGAAASWFRPLAPELPPPVTDLAVFTPEVLEAVATYRGPRAVVAVVATVLQVAVPLGVVLTPWGRAAVVRIAGPLERSARRAALVAGVVSVATSVVLLPLAYWSRVVHDGRWGFRTQSAGAWLRDWLVVSAGRWVAVAALVALLVAAIARWPRSWPYRLTVLGTVIAIAIVFVHPVVLQPVVLPTGPLVDGEHRAAIQAVLDAAGDPDLTVVVGAASRRTTRVNAQAVGLGPTARIVLHDTLLDLPPAQVASVVAHEVAHHQHRDLPRGVLLTATALLPGLLVLRRVLATERVRRSVTARGPADPRVIAVVLAFVAVVELVGTPATNLVTRRLEAAADARAVELTRDPATLIGATRVFTVRDLSQPEPATWITVLYRTHPSVTQRVEQAVAIAERDGLPLPTRDDLEVEEAVHLHPATLGGRG